LSGKSPATLAALFDANASAGAFGQDELASAWRHQLGARLEPDLADSMPERLATLRSDRAATASLARSYRDLLADPATPAPVLDAIGRLAKAAIGESDAIDPVMRAIYFLAIAAARVHCGTAISSLDPAGVRAGVDWVISQPWLDEAGRELASRLRRSLGGH
jgi:hypothetical protein